MLSRLGLKIYLKQQKTQTRYFSFLYLKKEGSGV